MHKLLCSHKYINFDSQLFGGIRLIFLLYSITSVLILGLHNHDNNSKLNVCKVDIRNLLIYFNCLWGLAMIGLSSWHDKLTCQNMIPTILFAFITICTGFMFIGMTIFITYYYTTYLKCYRFATLYGLVELYSNLIFLIIVLISKKIYDYNKPKRQIRDVSLIYQVDYNLTSVIEI